ncbi:MAG: ATP-binding protein [Burkholderiaceae bacterium]
MPTIDPDSDWRASLVRVLHKLDAMLPQPPAPVDFSKQWAFRWVRRPAALGSVAALVPVQHFASISLDDLCHIESQAERVVRNTEQFVAGRPANNVLLTGARGTGKSSLVRACLTAYGERGLRLIEVDKADMVDLPEIADQVHGRPERFILFCDDLSFETGDAAYKALKTVLDGGLSAQADNLLVYATSNRRHLMSESMRDNLSAHTDADGEIHPGETVEERISLSERFGLWVSFHSFSQAHYLDIVSHWLSVHGVPAVQHEAARKEALQWATARGSRSGRVALAFAKDWAAGHHGHNA